MILRRLRVAPILLSILVATLTASGLPAQAAQNPAPTHNAPVSNQPGTHTLNLKDADIQVLIATVSEITGKNFIVGPNVAGKVTVISATPQRADEIYSTFLGILRLHGYAAIPSGSMIKIVPEAAAQQDGSAGLGATPAQAADELVTQIVPVRHLAASELVPILRPLMPQGAQLIAHTGSNSLVVSDRAGNVARILAIIQRIDTVSDAQVETIALQHASAAEVARTLTQLTSDKGTEALGDAAKVFADERTNSILLSGGKSGRLRMRSLIAHLDTPLASSGDTNVVYLHYANAKDLVPILQGVAATLNGEAAPRPAGATAGAAAPIAGANNAQAAAAATIQAHEDTNALVISASPAVFRSLSNVIRQLDVRRAQVLIEAVIAEVSAESASELGVQWQLADKHLIGGTNFTSGNSGNAGNNILTATAGLNAINGSSGTPVVTLGNGFNLGYLESISIGGKKFLQLGALVTALRSNGKNNVLSTPSVMTLDNQQAIIKVGQEVPFLTGQYQTTATTNTGGSTGTNGISNPFQTIQRKDVGIKLTVTPHINEGDSVKLEIHQEVSSLAPRVSGASDLITNNREVQTTVLVKDDAILVLGGLISDNAQDSVQKVPLLGDIPLAGNLFRYRSNDHQKQNLMVFLHPRILRDAATEAAVSSEKYNYIRTEQLQLRETSELITPRKDIPMVPEVRDFLKSPPLDVTPPEGPARRQQ